MTAANRDPDHAARYGELPPTPWQHAMEFAGVDAGDPLPAHDWQSECVRLRAVLARIVNEFDALNGHECKRTCGQCIKCIAQSGLSPAVGS